MGPKVDPETAQLRKELEELYKNLKVKYEKHLYFGRRI